MNLGELVDALSVDPSDPSTRAEEVVVVCDGHLRAIRDVETRFIPGTHAPRPVFHLIVADLAA